MTGTPRTARLMAGIPAQNNSLFHKIRFLAGDPAAWIQTETDAGTSQVTLLIRDIEIGRAKKTARADHILCPADLAPLQGLSGDRETATAQAVAEFMVRSRIQRVIADRSLPFIFVSQLTERGIQTVLDPDMGTLDRRVKSEEEITHLQHAQQMTEDAVALACRMVAGARPNQHGVLLHDGHELTSEYVRAALNQFFIQHGFDPCHSIIAGGPQGADCHDCGAGLLFTEQPVIIDVFPRDAATRYYGDCTRTVVNGSIPDTILRMHAAVLAAKHAAQKTLRAGTTGETVHRAAIEAIHNHGFESGFQQNSTNPYRCAMVHGTGHGVGLDVHEPPLLDFNGPTLLAGDVVTIEPGLYQSGLGGVRVEDLLVVTNGAAINLNHLPEDLDWSH